MCISIKGFVVRPASVPTNGGKNQNPNYDGVAIDARKITNYTESRQKEDMTVLVLDDIVLPRLLCRNNLSASRSHLPYEERADHASLAWEWNNALYTADTTSKEDDYNWRGRKFLNIKGHAKHEFL